MRVFFLGFTLFVATACGDNAGGASTSEDGGASGGGSSGANGTSAGEGGSAGSNGGADSEVPRLGGCPVFTSDDAWNTPIADAAVDADYTARLRRYLAARDNPDLHPDFGANWNGGPFGIPITLVPEGQPRTPISFEYDDESDPGPYPFPGPDEVSIEGRDPYAEDGDRHIIVVQRGSCKAYEAWACRYEGQWACGSGAVFDLRKNSYGQRPKGHTSADAAGLSILAGLVRYDEVRAGEVRHAIRFTLRCTASAFTHPASHLAVPGGCDGDDPDAMPMGVRVRLKADYDLGSLPSSARVIAQAMKTYGMILADNGSDFYFQGEPDARFSDEELNGLKGIPSTAFEVVAPVTPEM
jgi:hypothetical protein